MLHIQPGARVLNTAEGSGSPRQWSDALRAFRPAAAALLKSDTNTSVWRAAMLGREVVIKLWEQSTLSARLKLFFGGSRARRHWRGAQRLITLGVPSARPLALAQEFGRGSSREWLVLEFVVGRTLIDILSDCSGIPNQTSGEGAPPASTPSTSLLQNQPSITAQLSVKSQHSLAAALGTQIATIVTGGIYNRDHKPSNIIVSFDHEQRPTITVLDTVAIRRCPPGSLRRAAQMLASLHIEPSGLGCTARLGPRARCVRETAKSIMPHADAAPSRAAVRAASRLLWEEAMHMVNSHGDPRPRVDPRSARD